MTFAEFWPTYVLAHRKPATRAFHAVSSVAPFVFGGLAVATRSAWWLLAIPVAAYGTAWFSHFFIEHNRPATFDHALLSLMGDYKMLGLMLAGRMGAEVMRAEAGRAEAGPAVRDRVAAE